MNLVVYPSTAVLYAPRQYLVVRLYNSVQVALGRHHLPTNAKLRNLPPVGRVRREFPVLIRPLEITILLTLDFQGCGYIRLPRNSLAAPGHPPPTYRITTTLIPQTVPVNCQSQLAGDH